MNREIKFRGKTKPTEKSPEGIWLNGSLITNNETGRCFIDYAFSGGFGNNGIWKGDEVIPETIGQFTGKHDKDGKEIYEGDVISIGTIHKLIKFINERAAFCMANIDELHNDEWTDIWQCPSPKWWVDFNPEIEVIGNIHDNPELLTRKYE